MIENINKSAMVDEQEPKEPLVIAQIETIRAMSHGLSARLAELEDRLSPVIIPNGPKPVCETDCVDHQVPLANVLNDIAQRLEDSGEKILSMTNRLEI